MAIREVAIKKFKLQKEASAWAKEEKQKQGKSSTIKWETNRINDPNKPWEAIVYREVK